MLITGQEAVYVIGAHCALLHASLFFKEYMLFMSP